jgi:hypothetical protein
MEPPTNDFCNGAVALTAGVPYRVNTLNATEKNDPTNCVPGFGRGIWFTYTPTVSRRLGVGTCGSSFDTGLSVFSGTCAGLTSIACQDDNGPLCPNSRASVNFQALAGTQYYFLAGGKNGAGGDLEILITDVDLMPTNLHAAALGGASLAAGRPISVGWSVLNQGVNPIHTFWTDRLTLSNSVTNITLYAQAGLHEPVPGSSYTYAFAVDLGFIPPGTFSLIAESDSQNVIAETNETNNVQTLSLVITNLAPTNVLLTPSGSLTQTTCIPLSFWLTARATAGSYPITNVAYFDGPTKIGDSANRGSFYKVLSTPLTQGFHTITAEAIDLFGFRATSKVATVSLNWPELHHLHANLATNGEVVCCLGTSPGSNYVIEAAAEMRNNPPWQPYFTNLAIGTDVLLFTNSRPLLRQLYFRAREF